MNNRFFGFDLDNTIIDYSTSVRIYSQKNLEFECDNIVELRLLYRRNNREIEWQKAQSWIYTEGLAYAKLSPGIKDLFSRLLDKSIPFCIVSHKTFTTPKSSGNLELRGPATQWIRDNVEIQLDTPIQIYFESSRSEKIERIQKLKVTDFVDDLFEVLLDPKFPQNVNKILYEPYSQKLAQMPGIHVIKEFDQL